MVLFGIDVLAKQHFAALQGKRVGLLTNPSAVNKDMLSTYQVLVDAENVNLVALYGAEHGAFGRVEAGEHVEGMVDARTGIPVHSLYGKTYRPSPEMLTDIDVMVCDIQDIGLRYYTYLWTMTYVVEACGAADIPVIILDRPNPLGANVAGRGLEGAISSLVGRYNVPIQHGMTVGEVLQMHNAIWNNTPADLTIIACEGYQHQMIWADFERPFIAPSPNMPHMLTVKQYAGACLIEGTNLSEGRGTTIPFQIAGAPYIDGRDLADALNQLDLADVRFRPHQFTPLMSKYAGEACEGVEVHMIGSNFDAISTWLHVIHTVKDLYPEQFAWVDSYVENDYRPFDKLIGSELPRIMFDKGASVANITQAWAASVAKFIQQRQPYMIYESVS
ncbi:MAG: DUF1343 domain-containing protein [Phototrophicaceae bacterium]